jgi:hypothetical protein
MHLGPEVFALLMLAGFAAGFIDSIAGGGGLVTVPAMLAAGIPPVHALATNKLQSVFSVATACTRFARRGYIDFRRHGPTALLIFVCAAAGALAVQHVSTRLLAWLMPGLILCVMAYVLLSPRMTDEDAHQRLSVRGYLPVAGAIGFYDGFFGPGTGSFFITSSVALRGMGLIRAAGHSKLFNLASNAASVLLFAIGGKMLWLLGFCMAGAAMAGAWIGSHMAMRFGANVIRPLLLLVSLTLTAKLLWDNFG